MPDPNMPDLAQAMERLKARIADIAVREAKAKKLDEQSAAFTARAEKIRKEVDAARAELNPVFAILGISRPAQLVPTPHTLDAAHFGEKINEALCHFRKLGKPFTKPEFCAYITKHGLLAGEANDPVRIGIRLRSMASRKRLTILEKVDGYNRYTFPEPEHAPEAAPVSGQKPITFRVQVLSAIQYLEQAGSLVTPRAIRGVLNSQGMTSEAIRSRNLNACLCHMKRVALVHHTESAIRGASGEYKLTDEGKAALAASLRAAPAAAERSA